MPDVRWGKNYWKEIGRTTPGVHTKMKIATEERPCHTWASGRILRRLMGLN